MAWSWTDIFQHPLWAFSTVILGLVVRAQRKGSWDPRACKVDLTGKTAIVTGANTGIGKFIALDLARRGARVILACRSPERGQRALEEIRARSGNANVHLRLLDTSSLRSVREFARRVLQEEKQLHILVNNAGASGLPRGITEDGLEVSFATNHLGPFLLTNLLLDLMKSSAPARIVNVSSANHWRGKVDFSHFRGENLTYTMDSVYNHTKLHNILCTNELAHRLQGTGVTANSLHPGVVMTEVMRHYNVVVRLIFNLIGFFFFKSSEEGAVSSIYCAVSEDVEGVTGKYFDSDCSLRQPAPLARDPALARKDWEVCERLTGLSSQRVRSSL
ncbi:retinol dehydrogenase 12 [Lepisosteus oculatus]|nr:PREDICTED: retinol dehydrogenase 12-like [Lepisosteus oculatus]XP_015216801.1 PREDICTED: retinol dehydrogenase 12-like [Lepisosteus oculatus]